MAEVAGLVLGAVPLILYAIGQYRDVREAISNVRNWRDNLKAFGIAINLQQMTLEATLRELDIEVTERIKMEHVEAALRISHPIYCDMIMSHIQTMNNTMDQLAMNLCPGVPGPVRLVSSCPTFRSPLPSHSFSRFQNNHECT
jgi:hypothetical protein